VLPLGRRPVLFDELLGTFGIDSSLSEGLAGEMPFGTDSSPREGLAGDTPFDIDNSPIALAGDALRVPNTSGAVAPCMTGAAPLVADELLAGVVDDSNVDLLSGDSSSKDLLLMRVGLLGSAPSATTESLSWPVSNGGRPLRDFLFLTRGWNSEVFANKPVTGGAPAPGGAGSCI